MDAITSRNPGDRPVDKASLQTKLSLPDSLAEFRKRIEQGRIHTLEPLLPLLLSLKGKPYTLEDHFPFAPLFRTRMPYNLVVKSGRQVAKSTTVSANGIVVANSIPFFNTLYVTPLYDQVRRLSNNYVRTFIETSPVKALWTGTSTENSVLQRSFKNHSKLFFSFALLDAERVRGYSADRINFDEVQDMDPDHLPIIKEVMSASKWGIQWFTGTPKTNDNTLEKLWKRSSMAEWFILCEACNHWNIPSREHDLFGMIGPLHDNIGEFHFGKLPAIVCAKCRKPVNPRTGRWVHRKPDRRWDFAGYHIPQIIMPMHYASRKKWAELLAKMRGAGNTTPAMFQNEVLGESCELGVKLVTETDLQRAATLPWANDEDNPAKIVAQCNLNTYTHRCLAVDWGGGGEEEVSFTTLAVLGFHGSGRIDVLWGKRSLMVHDPILEANECLKVFNTFKCHFLAHDYTGAGALRETFVVHAGLDLSRIVPVMLCRTAKRDIMTFHPGGPQSPRDYWLLDKARSLQLTSQCIKFGHVRTFKYDYVNADETGLLHDWLALMENKVATPHAGDIYTIIRAQTAGPDDFAQAMNIGCCALWRATESWPNLASLAGLQQIQDRMPGIFRPVTEAQLEAASPDVPWSDQISDSGMDSYFGIPGADPTSLF